MYHEFLSSASFWLYLRAVDEDLAAETRNKGCPCGGRLHCANYPRKPEGTPAQLPEPQLIRLASAASRRLQEESDAPFGALPGPKGLLGRHRDPDQRHAARAVTTPGS